MAVEAAVRREEKQRVAAGSAPFGPDLMKGQRRRRRGTCEFEAWASDLEQIGKSDLGFMEQDLKHLGAGAG